MSLNLLKDKSPIGLELLDWHLIVADLSSLAHFDNSKERFNLPPKYSGPERIEKKFDAVQFFLELVGDSLHEVDLTIGELPSESTFFKQLDLLSKGKIFSLQELNFIAILIEKNRILQKKLKDWSMFSRFESNQSVEQKLYSQFVNRLRQFVDPDGTVNYFKHPLLRELFKEVNELEKDLRSAVQYLSRSSEYDALLQFKEHDVVNDRFVLAVRSDSYKSELGPIVAKSSTGMTLFIEPPALRDRSNRRIRLLAQIEAVITKIAQEFSEYLFPFSSDLGKIKSFILEVDFTIAKAKYISANGLTRPELNDEFTIELWDFFHPLIDDPITNTIFLNQSERGLILSGPNTGGKTVALKSISLCQLFIQMGIYIPASKANIFPVEAIFYFSSDQQNIAEGLSSFASETISYLSIFDHFEGSNLIVVDEIFNSTSSEEASALAIAFLEEIHKSTSAKVLISTHHQLFKTFIHGNNQYVSAHVGHDDATNAPTYKIFTGEPGSSMAFSIFSRIANTLEKTSLIPNRAAEILDNKHISYEKLLQDLSSKKSELDKLLRENRELNLQLKNEKQSMDGLVNLEKQRIVDEYKKELDRSLSAAGDLLKKIRNGEVTTNKQLNRHALDVKHAITRDVLHIEKSDSNYSDIELQAKDVFIGARYFSNLVGKEFEVTAINTRKSEVQGLCQKRVIKCPISSLRLLKNTPNTFMPKASRITINVDIEKRGIVDLDLRGMRLDDFKREIEISLIELINGDIPFLNIIHGHGTGVLKKWLREYLKGIKEVHFQAEDGNDGCTHVIRST